MGLHSISTIGKVDKIGSYLSRKNKEEHGDKIGNEIRKIFLGMVAIVIVAGVIVPTYLNNSQSQIESQTQQTEVQTQMKKTQSAKLYEIVGDKVIIPSLEVNAQTQSQTQSQTQQFYLE